MELVKEAIRQAYVVIEDHRRRGLPLAVWQDEKVVWISADEIDIGSEQPAPETKRNSEIEKQKEIILAMAKELKLRGADRETIVRLSGLPDAIIEKL